MPTAPTAEPGRKAGASHIERMLGVKTGQWVLITRECPIGEDHTYSDSGAVRRAPLGRSDTRADRPCLHRATVQQATDLDTDMGGVPDDSRGEDRPIVLGPARHGDECGHGETVDVGDDPLVEEGGPFVDADAIAHDDDDPAVCESHGGQPFQQTLGAPFIVHPDPRLRDPRARRGRELHIEGSHAERAMCDQYHCVTGSGCSARRSSSLHIAREQREPRRMTESRHSPAGCSLTLPMRRDR
ncbi:hypothetical protein KNO15_18880 [Leifsonia shinshuensis]|uniref:hypothetical protein n=1 Tax=Leifsonia shinshuensis TaxID=150026 RepID=UPI001F507F8D|nr:hypothetical protein [Leifsonia shinshuensis]MCI0158769.1 hypothetical protein [Leifsonia shinshuensis]